MRLGLKFTRHDHIPEMNREIWSRLSYMPVRGLLHAPDRLVEIHDTSKYYIGGIRIKSYPYSSQEFVYCTVYGFGDRDKDKFVGDFMSWSNLAARAQLQRLTAEMEGISLQDVSHAYNTTARTGENTTEERLIRRMMDAEEIQITS